MLLFLRNPTLREAGQSFDPGLRDDYAFRRGRVNVERQVR